jgi:hypothetical protein
MEQRLLGLLVSLVLAAVFAICVGQARSATVDQEYAPATLTVFTQFNAARMAQAFTAGRSGLLTGVDVNISQLDPQGNLIVEIHDTLMEGPITYPMSILGSVSIPLSDVPSSSPGGTGPAFVAIDLSHLYLYVSAGHQYALALHRDHGDLHGGQFGVAWFGGRADEHGDYPGGTAFAFGPAGDFFDHNGNTFYLPDRWGAAPQVDFAFRTYVVPEPSSLVVGAWSIGIAGLRLRTRVCRLTKASKGVRRARVSGTDFGLFGRPLRLTVDCKPNPARLDRFRIGRSGCA